MPQRFDRQREAICPTWCSGHDELFQAWEGPLDQPPTRYHASTRPTVTSAVGVDLIAEETPEGLQVPGAALSLPNDQTTLTPAEARAVAAALVGAADALDEAQR